MANDNPELELSVNEGIKTKSNYLRGTISEGLLDNVTGAISEDDQQLIKFHGIYQQDNRDIRAERRQQKLEPAYSFMIRSRVPGGVFDTKHWLLFDDLASKYGEENFRLTTRQAFQLHGVIKTNLKQTIKEINDSLLDTLAACGDVNRNVMCSIAPHLGPVFHEVVKVADDISAHLTPQTSAYHEIWLDGKQVNSEPPVEPIYGQTYLPRKFKIGIAIPPYNDIDVYSQDIGFIAIINDGKLKAFNIVVGGGMGTTHSDETTYPRAGSNIGSCLPEQVVDVAEKIVTIQRDFGNRSNRKRARFKYTIDDRGINWLSTELNNRLGYNLGPAHAVMFNSSGDEYGWKTGADGKHHITLFIPQGRVVDEEKLKIRTALKEIAEIHNGEMILTPNQNLTISQITNENRGKIEKLLKQHDILTAERLTTTRQRSIACVALPTCALAMAEAERYLPDFITKFDALLTKNGLKNEEVSIRITGCPNGCARPFLAEVALIGKAPGLYNLYLGGGFVGQRLNKLYLESLNESQILEKLEVIIQDYSKNRQPKERFGDFTIRKGYIKEVTEGRLFHEN
ncbi:NADPH-dependent assimilatory sulfite reductase hemoprotein subunit [Francisellaceae bacterium]|nr:NADPH-dependent assimilatory sulfite reductase hemoprotein subunit [Francisellaceae bacterium]